MVQPPKLDVDALVGTREVVFVVDVSGSMRGVPLALCKEAMIDALRRLRPVDTFNIITFASGTVQLFDAPRPANQHAIRTAMDFVDQMRSGGGTRMLAGVKQALQAPIEPGVQRYVVFLTDGYIGNEAEIIGTIGESVDTIASRNARARVFAFGVGSSINHHLINNMAREGDGTSYTMLNRESPSNAVQSLYHTIDHPILTDVEIDFGSLEVLDMYPARVRDLFASQPLVFHGRSDKPCQAQIMARPTHQGTPIELPIQASPSTPVAAGAIPAPPPRPRV